MVGENAAILVGGTKIGVSMARALFETLSLSRRSLSPPGQPAPLIGIFPVRHCAKRSGKVQLVEISLESDSGDVEVMGIRRLEDAIHRIIVQRLAPDWLPFLPGSSYWVPPTRRQIDLLKCMGKLAGEMSVENALALTAVHGWPSAPYFIQDNASKHQLTAENVEVEEVRAEVEAQTDSQDMDGKNKSQSSQDLETNNNSRSEDEQ